MLVLESSSLPTLGVRRQLDKLYFYLCSEEPFSVPSSCWAVFVGVSRQCLKKQSLSANFLLRFHEFYLASKELLPPFS